MQQDIPLLDNVRVATPCPANWDEMVGGERVRYCRSCEKNVYNLSEMTKDEAENLLQTHDGKLCIRYYQRADGKIMTQNCPVGLRTLRRAYLTVNAKVAALLTAIFGVSAAFLFPVVAGGAEYRSSKSLWRDINHNEKEIAKEKAVINDPKHPLSDDEREALQSMIEFNRRHIKDDLQILQKRAEDGKD